jgi:ATP-dependent helicase IRC3
VPSLRPHQQAAIAAYEKALNRGVQRQLFVMPTGSGKTVIFAAILAAQIFGQALVIVPRGELAQQAAGKLREWAPERTVGIEAAGSYADPNADIVVATIQTLLQPKRHSRFDWKNFTTIVIDEAHHFASDSWLAVVEEIIGGDQYMQVLGFSATPQRHDGHALDKLFREIVFEYDLLAAIDDGVCAMPIGYRATTVTDLSNVRKAGGDFAARELGEKCDSPQRNELIVKHWLNRAAGRRTLVFACNVAHAKSLAHTFNVAGVGAEAIWADDFQRSQKLANHAAAAFPVLVNVAIATEGYDDQQIDCIVLARPTLSEPLYRQMVGRGLRVALGKNKCLVLDICDNTIKHDLVSLASLAGLPKTSRVIDGESLTEARSRGIAEKQEIERKHLVEEALLRKRELERRGLATNRQIKYLGRLGYKGDPTVLSVEEATAAINQLKEGPRALWQAAVIKKEIGEWYEPHELTYAAASEMINKF